MWQSGCLVFSELLSFHVNNHACSFISGRVPRSELVGSHHLIFSNWASKPCALSFFAFFNKVQDNNNSLLWLCKNFKVTEVPYIQRVNCASCITSVCRIWVYKVRNMQWPDWKGKLRNSRNMPQCWQRWPDSLLLFQLMQEVSIFDNMITFFTWKRGSSSIN